MDARLTFFNEPTATDKAQSKKLFQHYMETFSTFAKITQNTLYYIDHSCKKIYFSSFNSKVSEKFFEHEVDLIFWNGLLDNDGLLRLQIVNQAINSFTKNEAHEYGWKFNIKFVLYLLFDNQLRPYNITAIPIHIADNKMQSMLYFVLPHGGEDSEELVVTYTDKETYFTYNFDEKRFFQNDKVALSSLEISIIKYSGQGLSQQDLTEKFSISLHELKNIKYKLFLKMKVKSMPQALFMLHKMGLLNT